MLDRLQFECLNLEALFWVLGTPLESITCGRPCMLALPTLAVSRQQSPVTNGFRSNSAGSTEEDPFEACGGDILNFV